MTDINRTDKNTRIVNAEKGTDIYNFVLDKNIFSNIFEKDIQRIYIYKKAERLAKAIHLVTPAFRETPALANRLDAIAVGLIDAAILPPIQARGALSRELLALSSVLSIARTGAIISVMNAEFIAREAHLLLQEIALYEEPRVSLPAAMSLPELAKGLSVHDRKNPSRTKRASLQPTPSQKDRDKGQTYIGQTEIAASRTDRKEAILSVLKSKGPSRIKDISTALRDIGEKTLQRELAALVLDGSVRKEGERRWTLYTAVL